MKKRILITSFTLIMSLLLVACNTNNTTQNTEDTEKEADTSKLKIYTTIFPLEDFTKKIGGDLIEVESVLPPGVDGHTYEPTTKTMVDIAKSAGFIYSGFGIESFADKVQQSLEKEDVAFINAGEGIELATNEHAEDEHAHEEDEHAGEEAAHEDEHAHEEDEHAGEDATHDHGDTDPHVWLDPILSIQLAENIKNALIDLDPSNTETFEKNFETLKTQLEELDHSFEEVVANSEKKEILVSHAAYGYWESRYGIEQISVLGLSPTEEPSQKELQNIIETAKEHKLKYIIFETNVSSNVTDIVQTEIGAEALTLSNLESITEENIKNKEDYFSLMTKNLKTLEQALN
ncbi:zinc transport system substrate-binding protein [Metabacillus crassostreae]|uniref:metal ABC transporter solute-binding protein, Zn/Mn family n=1 Tax=Metabacillus crassostreae TaxID=929098 RepID=UPI001958E89D|nr:zinc ABC transporter substrate-binding protein [Metabacillus crassostreae]MBM7606064.1 zinc transport system substrate-binding protein [Metabacillus crassostreae]